jgi:hypothetical protein
MVTMLITVDNLSRCLHNVFPGELMFWKLGLKINKRLVTGQTDEELQYKVSAIYYRLQNERREI